MEKVLLNKIKDKIQQFRQVYSRVKDWRPFIAFSTGKDSLAMASMLYEALESDTLPCVYVHHDLEFPVNLQYAERLRERGFEIEIVNPFLGYFELIDRGISFITLKNPWCVPMLVGTGILHWLRNKGANSAKECVMFRGMSGSEYSRKFHNDVELYDRLDLPCFNPLLNFAKEEILTIIKERYGLPLNPIYDHMDRTYCICCYTSDQRRQAYSRIHYPEVYERYYNDIKKMLFESGLIDRSYIPQEYKTKEEKLDRHGFIYWRRNKMQDIVGAVKYKLPGGAIIYQVRTSDWINTKHLCPVDGRWAQIGNEIRFWDVQERDSDVLIKRMINCLDCGFCMVECFPCRQFDRTTKTLRIEGCIQCGKCIRLKFCMGWRHRFWRRVIVEDS